MASKDKGANRGHHGGETIKKVRDFITLGLPLFQVLAESTKTKVDDIGVKVLQVINTNDEIANLIAEAIDAGHVDDEPKPETPAVE